MKRYSFRFKITFTLIIVVATISFFAFYIYNNYLSKKIYKNAEENIVSVMDLLKDQYFFTIIREDGGKVIYSLLKKMEENKHVLNTYLINSEGKVVYPDETTLDFDSLSQSDLYVLSEDITLKSYKKGPNPFLRMFIRMQNSPSCYECHSPSEKTLGFIVVDFSMKEIEKNIAFTQMFSMFFTIIMVFVIVGFVIIMHYKFVRKSLFHFQSSINVINQGNLDERVIIPGSKELGELGNSFNKMIANFQKTQKELQVYHQKELKNAHKLATIGEMAARLAHEIRNPITGIANAIEIIIDEMKEDENRPVLEEIRRQANRVNDAITDLLKYSRSKTLELKEGDINELIKSLVLFLQNQSHNEKIKFNMELYPHVPVFKFDDEQIENVLLNLGLNAIQAINHIGTITFETKYDPSEKVVTISVEDTGTGIPEDKLEEIFKPFYTTRTEGTGLGLAIAKDIIEKHEGELWVENGKETGCIFNISLPTETTQHSTF